MILKPPKSVYSTAMIFKGNRKIRCSAEFKNKGSFYIDFWLESDEIGNLVFNHDVISPETIKDMRIRPASLAYHKIEIEMYLRQEYQRRYWGLQAAKPKAKNTNIKEIIRNGI